MIPGWVRSVLLDAFTAATGVLLALVTVFAYDAATVEGVGFLFLGSCLLTRA